MLSSPEFIPDAILERKASDLLHEHERLSSCVVSLPIPIEAIVEHTLNLRVVWLPIEELPGEIILARIDPDYLGHPTIQLNEDRTAHFEEFFGTEQFSLAHEVGHWILHYARGQSQQLGFLSGNADETTVRILCRRLSDSDRRELQADRFAAYLLLPEHLLRPIAACRNLDRWSVITGLAHECGVSKRALARRLDALGLIHLSSSGALLMPPAPSRQRLF